MLAFQNYQDNFDFEKDTFWKQMKDQLAKQKQETQQSNPIKQAMSLAQGENFEMMQTNIAEQIAMEQEEQEMTSA